MVYTNSNELSPRNAITNLLLDEPLTEGITPQSEMKDYEVPCPGSKVYTR